MSLLPPDEPTRQTFAALDTAGFSAFHVGLPDRWADGDAVYDLRRLDATTWEVSADGAGLGLLRYVPQLVDGEAATWHIGDPGHETLGAGVSWDAWEDAVASLVDYRRER